jgi:hypothetical protein
LNTLIIKLNAAGDVVRTTPLLRRLPGDVTWVTAQENVPLLAGLGERLRCLAWRDRAAALDAHYDLVINLEDEPEPALFARSAPCERTFGAYVDDAGRVRYTKDSAGWFDLGLVSEHGRQEANRRKLCNRRTYQDLIFSGLGYTFVDDEYLLPAGRRGGLAGDVALAPVAGPVWPMKGWAYYEVLRSRLEGIGLRVNVLPRRATLLEHIGDVRSHACLVSGDSLPMHLALGAGVRCVTLFNCTSPWEIHGYGRQTKVVSPLLASFFYRRDMDHRATTAIAVDEVFDAVTAALEGYECGVRAAAG